MGRITVLPGAQLLPYDDQCDRFVCFAQSSDQIVVTNPLGQRLDSLMSNLSVLLECPHRRLVLLSSGSATVCLPTGTSTISRTIWPSVLEQYGYMSKDTCGLIPLGTMCTVSSTGFKWDLDKQELRFGGLVSSSNELVACEATVTTTAPLLFTLVLEHDTCSESPFDGACNAAARSTDNAILPTPSAG